MAVRATGSPKTSPHSLKLLFEVTAVDAFSWRALTSWKNRLAPLGVSSRYPISSTMRSEGPLSALMRSRSLPWHSASTSESTMSESVP